MVTSIYLHALLWGLVLVQGIVTFALVYQLAQLRGTPDVNTGTTVIGAQVRDPLPNFRVADLSSGATVTTAALRGRAKVFLFLTMNCSICKNLAIQLSQLSEDTLAGLVIICGGAERGCRNYTSGIAANVPILNSSMSVGADTRTLSELFDLAPIALVVNEKWQVGSVRRPSTVQEVLEALRPLPMTGIERSPMTART